MDKTLIVTRNNLRSIAIQTPIEKLELCDIVGPVRELYDAHCVLFLDDKTPRIKTLKNRFKQ